MRGHNPANDGIVNNMAKYAHFLQPIRDLTKNWDIDVASQLEEYLTEIGQIKISFDGGVTTMNFAEAALLIQGTAVVYSKKVEYLFALVYQTLDLIASKKRLQQAASVNDQGTDKDITFQNTEDEEFLSLNDIKEAKNIDLKDDYEDYDFIISESAKIIPQTPVSLIPNDGDGKEDNALLSRTGEVLGSRNDYKMNTCTVHPGSGAFVLDLTSFASWDTSRVILPASTPLMTNNFWTPAPLTTDLSTGNQGVNKDDTLRVDDEMAPPGDDMMDDFCGGDDDGFDPPEPLSPAPDNNPQETVRMQLRDRQRSLQPIQVQNPPEKDYWEMLDPYESTGKTINDKPCKKGKPYRLPSSLSSMKGGKKRKRKGVETTVEEKQKIPLQPLADFCTKAFHSHASKLPKNSLKAPAFPEFEYLYWIEHNKRLENAKQERKLLTQKLSQKQMDELDTIVQNGNDEEELGGGQPYDQAGADYDDFNMDNFGGDDDDEDDPEMEDRVPIAPMALEEPLEDLVVSSYEEMVRTYVRNFLAEAQQYAQETDLTRRVREWEEKILPTLEDEDNHGPYDIHKYGSDVLGSFKSEKKMTFHEVVQEKEPFEICRYFLATLQLANNRNVEICANGQGANAVDTMSVELLHKTQVNEAIATYKAPSSQT